jgi:hypothetical protein
MLHVRICAGGWGQPQSLPRPAGEPRDAGEEGHRADPPCYEQAFPPRALGISTRLVSQFRHLPGAFPKRRGLLTGRSPQDTPALGERLPSASGPPCCPPWDRHLTRALRKVSNPLREHTTKAQALFSISVAIPDEVGDDWFIGLGQEAPMPAVLSCRWSQRSPFHGIFSFSGVPVSPGPAMPRARGPPALTR